MENTRLMYRIVGLLAFAISLITFTLTVQPSVPFWDCGEFTSASVWQQVPHPPGAPLFLMVGKLFHLMPFGDPGWRLNMFSVMCSAFTIMLLYFIIVKAIENFRGKNYETLGESLAVYGSAFVGALAFNFSDTFWFNGVESEVYAASSLIVALCLYLLIRWNEVADKPGNERYILVIAYLIGLSIGIHLLSILTIFSLIYLIYFRKYETSNLKFIITGIISVVVFGLLYKGIIGYLPKLLDSVPFLVVIGLLGVLGAVYYGISKSKPIIGLAASTILLLVLGYSTYTHIIIRSNANPPMNENTPKTLHKLISYIGREQYGDAPSWPRRWQTESYFIRQHEKWGGKWYPPRPGTREFNQINTAGELSYLWNFQISHMYLRYFYWNFVGRSSDIQDSPTAWFGKGDSDVINYNSGYSDMYPIRFFALPLIFGLLGLFFHFYKDPKIAFTYLIAFLLLGVLAAVAQNQQDPQPRERDYFYVSSFFVFSMWIGIGVFSLIDQFTKNKGTLPTGIVSGVLALSILLVPINMAFGGWKLHSRAGNYIPFDYSYNILQSLEKDAIVFTNGDNDTFPLWYLQDVAGVRRDVRVVNLSLGNTLWYVDQLKNQEPHGAKKIPLSFSNESLNVDESDPKALRYELSPAQSVAIPVSADIMKKYLPANATVVPTEMRFNFVGQNFRQGENGQPEYIMRVQDKLVLDILRQTKFERPVYYSITVGPDAYCGLEDFFRMEGMAYRICPVSQKNSATESLDPEVMKACLTNIDNTDNYSQTPKFGFKFRGLNNSGIFYDEVHRRLMGNYRQLYLRYASYLLNENKNKEASDALDILNSNISADQFPMPFVLEYQIADFYFRAGNTAQANSFAKRAIESSKVLIANPQYLSQEPYARQFSPYDISAECYAIMGDMTNAKLMLDQMRSQTGSNPNSIQAKLDQMEISNFEKQGKFKEALDATERLKTKYATSSDEFFKSMIPSIEQRAGLYRAKLGLSPKDTAMK